MQQAVHINEPALWLNSFHWPTAGQHKHDRGHVLVWGGYRMVGAARLAARAAAKSGAGLVTLLVPELVWPVYAAHLMSAMAQPLADETPVAMLRAWADALAQARWRALVLGPGGAAGLPHDATATMRELVVLALQSPGDGLMVLDADALTAFETCPAVLMQAIQTSTHPVVMTPHEGEFNRLFQPDQVGDPSALAMKIERTTKAAQLSGAIVVHKGAQTVLASPDGRVVVNDHAPPWLATAGSGDVLTGFIAACSAQGMPTMEAACMATWLHGECAFVCGPGLISEDLPEQVAKSLKALKPW